MHKNIAAYLLILLLLASFGTGYAQEDPAVAVGDIVIVEGRITDTAGNPVAAARVDLWQADANGVYAHSEFEGERDASFQYYGVSITDTDGMYSFTTLRPAGLDEMPALLNLRITPILADSVDIQLFFEENDDAPVLVFEMMDDGDPTATQDIVIDMGMGGDLALTPTVEAADYYPEVDFGDFDNVLVGDAVAEADSSDSAGRVLYRIVPAESEVQFILQEDLRGQRIDVIGTTNEVAGDMVIDFAEPIFSQLGTIRINARTLETDNDFRNRAIRAEILLAARDEYEFIEFVPTSIDNLPESVAVGEPYSFTVTGDLTIIGNSRPVTFDVEGVLESEDRATGFASAVIFYADWGITIPEVPGVANITEDVTLTIDFVATSVDE